MMASARRAGPSLLRQLLTYGTPHYPRACTSLACCDPSALEPSNLLLLPPLSSPVRGPLRPCSHLHTSFASNIFTLNPADRDSFPVDDSPLRSPPIPFKRTPIHMEFRLIQPPRPKIARAARRALQLLLKRYVMAYEGLYQSVLAFRLPTFCRLEKVKV